MLAANDHRIYDRAVAMFDRMLALHDGATFRAEPAMHREATAALTTRSCHV